MTNAKKNYKLTAEEKEIKLMGILEDIVATLDSICENFTYIKYDKKHKISVQIEGETNLFEVFYTLKGRFHICTKYNLSKFDESAKYHELWDMGWDVYTNSYSYFVELVNFIIDEYNAG